MMNTWDVARWMSEANKVFNAAIGGPIDAIKFEDYTQEVTPWGNCNTKHETEGWRTRSGIGNDSHALTDQVFVNFRLRDTDDWDCSYIVNCDTSYNAKKANAHGIGLKLIHEDSPADNPDYSWEENGVENGATNVLPGRNLI